MKKQAQNSTKKVKNCHGYYEVRKRPGKPRKFDLNGFDVNGFDAQGNAEEVKND